MERHRVKNLKVWIMGSDWRLRMLALFCMPSHRSEFSIASSGKMRSDLPLPRGCVGRGGDSTPPAPAVTHFAPINGSAYYSSAKTMVTRHVLKRVPAKETGLQVFALHFKWQQLPKNCMTPLDAKKDFVSSCYVTKYALVIPEINVSLQTAPIVTLQKQASRRWLFNNLSVLIFFPALSAVFEHTLSSLL